MSHEDSTSTPCPSEQWCGAPEPLHLHRRSGCHHASRDNSNTTTEAQTAAGPLSGGSGSPLASAASRTTLADHVDWARFLARHDLYLHLLQEGPDGKLHLPLATSPEYPQKAPDTNYNLALLRWGCTALIESCRRLKIDDPLLPQWRQTLARLTPYPVDAGTGLMIGQGVPLAISHRHFVTVAAAVARRRMP